jgi:hypothetical protein
MHTIHNQDTNKAQTRYKHTGLRNPGLFRPTLAAGVNCFVLATM